MVTAADVAKTRALLKYNALVIIKRMLLLTALSRALKRALNFIDFGRKELINM